MSVIAAIGLVLTCVIGVWSFIARLKSEKRKMADEAKKDIEKAISPDGSASDILDGFGRL